MTKPNAYVFDLDGTLCDVRHRRHWVASKPQNWAAFNAAIAHDGVNVPVFQALRGLQSAGNKVILLSGREDSNRGVTEEWLFRHGVEYDELIMRGTKDYRKDSIIKSEFVDELVRKYNIVGAFDDRQQVVEMWIARGIFVFDVSQGQGNF